MFVRSNGKTRLSDKGYAGWLWITTLLIPLEGVLIFGLSFVMEIHPVLAFGVLSIFGSFMGLVLHISKKRKLADTFAYDGLVSVIPATEDHSKQVIFRLYKGPEALDDASSVSFKVDHGAIPIVEFDDDVEIEDDEEEPRK